MLNFIDLISHKKLILNLNKYKSLEEQLKFLNNNFLKYQKNFHSEAVLSLFNLSKSKEIIYLDENLGSIFEYLLNTINLKKFMICSFCKDYNKIRIIYKLRNKIYNDEINLPFNKVIKEKKILNYYRNVPILKWTKDIILNYNVTVFQYSRLSKEIYKNRLFKNIYSRNMVLIEKIKYFFDFFKKGIKISREDSYETGCLNDAFLNANNQVLFTPSYMPSKCLTKKDLIDSRKTHNSKWSLILGDLTKINNSKLSIKKLELDFEKRIKNISKINYINIKKDFDFSYKIFSEKLFNNRISNFKLEKNSTKIQWIFYLHSFSDSVYCYGNVEYGTIYNFFYNSFKNICKQFPNDEFLIKLHPNSFSKKHQKISLANKDYFFFSKLIKKLSHLHKIKLINPKIRLWDLKQIKSIGITHHGNICMEGAYLNIPILYSKYSPLVKILDKSLILDKKNFHHTIFDVRKKIINKNYKFNNKKNISLFAHNFSKNFLNKKIEHIKDQKFFDKNFKKVGKADIIKCKKFILNQSYSKELAVKWRYILY